MDHGLPAAAGGEIGVVGDDDECDAVLTVEIKQQVFDDLSSGRVEVSGGLVGEDYRGICDKRASYDKALLLPARKVFGPVFRFVSHVEAFEHLQSAPAPLRRMDASDGKREGDIMQHRLASDEEELLKYEPKRLVSQLLQLPPAEIPGWRAVHGYGAGGGAVQQRHRVHERGLA